MAVLKYPFLAAAAYYNTCFYFSDAKKKKKKHLGHLALDTVTVVYSCLNIWEFSLTKQGYHWQQLVTRPILTTINRDTFGEKPLSLVIKKKT